MVQTYFFTLFRTCDKIIIIFLASISVFVTHCVNACCATNVRVLRRVYLQSIKSTLSTQSHLDDIDLQGKSHLWIHMKSF